MSAHKLNKYIEKHFEFEEPLNEKTMGIPTEILHTCNTCGLDLEWYNYNWIQKGKNNLKKTKNSSRCKKCQRKRDREVTKMKKLHPLQPNQKCALDGCDKPAEHCDHEEVSKRFRGWMCPDHNQGYGKIGDSPEAALKFVKYDLQTLEDEDRKKELKKELEEIIKGL